MKDAQINPTGESLNVSASSLMGQQLSAASLQFKKALTGIDDSQQAAHQNWKALNQPSIVSPNALVTDDELDTFAGASINTGLGALDFLANALTGVINTPLAIQSASDMNKFGITQADIQAYASLRQKQSQASQGNQVEYSPEEQALMEKQTLSPVNLLNVGLGGINPADVFMGRSKQDVLDDFMSRQDVQQAITEANPLTDMVNQSEVAEMAERAGQVWDEQSGKVKESFNAVKNGDLSKAGDLIADFSSMSVDAIVESLVDEEGNFELSGLAQLLGTSVAAAATSARAPVAALTSYATNSVNEAVEAFEKENKRLPDADEMNTIITASIGKAVVATQSDRFLAKGGKLFDKTPEVPNTFVSKTMPKPTDPVADSVKGFVGGTISEGIAEGTESALEQYAVKQDIDKISGREVFANSILGSAAGGMVAGGASAVQALGAVVNSADSAITKKKQADEAAIGEGLAREGDTGITELDNTIYESDEVRNASEVDTSTHVGIAKTLRNVTKLVADAKTTPEVKEEAALLAKNTVNVTKSRIESLQETITGTEEVLAEENVDAETRKNGQAIISAAQKEITKLTKVLDNYETVTDENFKSLVIDSGKLDDIKSRITDIESSTQELATGTGRYTLSDKDAAILTDAVTQNRTGENAVTLVTAQELETASKNPTISKPRQAMLYQAAVIENAIADGGMAKVSNDIINGGEGFVGIRQYQQRIYDSLNINKLSMANTQLAKLSNFAQFMQTKADAYQAALEQVQTMPKGSRVEVQGQVNTKGEPVTIDANAGNLVNTITNEAALVNQTYQALNTTVQAFQTPTESTQETSQEVAVDETTEVEQTPTESVTEAPVDSEVQEDVTTSDESIDDNTDSDTTSAEPSSETSSEATETTTDVTEESSRGAEGNQGEPETVSENREVEEEAVTEEVVEEAPQSRIISELNDGATAPAPKGKTRSEADTKFLATNHVKETLKTRARGLMGKVNIFDAQEVATGLDRTLNRGEVFMLQVMQDLVTPFSTSFNAVVRPAKQILKDRGYQYRKPVEYFTQADGTYSDEFKQVLAISAFEYMENNASMMQAMTPSGMARILGLDTNGFKPTGEQSKLLADAGVPVLDVIQPLGQVAMKNLGLKKDPSKSLSIQNAIEQDLGRLVYSTLVELGAMVPVQFTGAQLNEVGGNYNNPEAVITSVKLNMDMLKAAFDGNSALEVFGSTDSFIESLTSVSREKRKVEIGKKTQKVSNEIRRSGGQRVTKEIVAGANKDAEAPHYVNKNMHNVFNLLGDTVMARIMGEGSYTIGKNGEKVYGAIKGILPTLEGKGVTIASEIRTYKEFISRMEAEGHPVEGTPFYYNYRFGKQMRLTAIGSDINYQRSKLHRYLTNIQPSTIDPSNPNNQDFIVFKLAVAQGMGVGIDKQTVAKSLFDYEQLVSNPTVQAAVGALVKSIKGQTLTNEDVDAIVDASDIGGENVHSLKSLMSLAELQIADGQPFETTVTYEIDGVSNGAFNAHVQMGIMAAAGKLTPDSVKRLNQGGFFFDGSDNYAEWISNPANWDIYQSTAMAINEKEQEMLESLKNDDAGKAKKDQRYDKYSKAYFRIKQSIADILKFDEDGTVSVTKDGRNLAKPSVTTKVYGAGEVSISDKAAYAYIDKLYKNIEKARANYDVDAMADMESELQDVFGYKIDLMNNPVDFVLSPKQVGYLKAVVKRTLGKMINTGVGEEFTTQLVNTSLVLESSNMIFEMFNTLYQKAIKDKLAADVAAGTRSTYEYLSESELEAIKESLLHTMPVFKTYYGNIKNGIQTSKFRSNGKVHEDHEKYFRIEKSSKYATDTVGYAPVIEAPAAGTVALLNIGNGDAMTMARAAMNSDSYLGMNVWDARIARVSDVSHVKEALNVAAYEAVMNHSQLGSVNNRFFTAFKAFKEAGLDFNSPDMMNLKKKAYIKIVGGFMRGNQVFEKLGEGEPQLVPESEINTSITEEMVIDMLTAYQNSLHDAHGANDKAKKVIRKNKIVANQFEAIGAGVTMKNGKVSNTGGVSAESLQNAVNEADKALLAVVKSAPEDADIDTELANAEGTQETTYVSKEANETLTSLVVNGEIAWTALADNLEAVYPTNTARGKLMEHIINTMNKNGMLPRIRVANQTYQLSDGTLSADIRGFYDVDTHTIVLNGASLEPTGLRPETLAHELVHAATTNAYNAIMAAQSKYVGANIAVAGYTAAQVTAAKRINKLYEAAQKSGSDLSANAMDNVYEFMAWGLTNPKTSKALNMMPHKLRKVVTKVTVAMREMLGIKPSESTIFTELFDNVAIIASAKTELARGQTLYQRMEADMNQASALDLFDQLGKDTRSSKTHVAYLRRVLEEAVGNTLDPFLSYIDDPMKSLDLQTKLEFDAMSGEIDHQLDALAMSKFGLTGQENYVYGLYSLVLKEALNSHGYNTAHIQHLYRQAKAKLTWRDFLYEGTLNTEEDNQVAEANAKARYELVFGNEDTGRVRDYLVNFLALSQVSETFRDSLAEVETERVTDTFGKGKSFHEKLHNSIRSIFNFFNNLFLTRLGGNTVGSSLNRLALNLRHHNNKQRMSLLNTAFKVAGFASTVLNGINAMTKHGIDGFFKVIEGKLNSAKLRSVDGAVTLASAFISQQRADALAFGLDSLQAYTAKGREGFMAALWTEIKGSNISNRRIHNLLAIKNKMIDQENFQTAQHIKRIIRSELKLNERQSVSMTKALLKTDATILLDNGFTHNQVAELLANPSKLKQTIADRKAQLRTKVSQDLYNYYNNTGTALARYMARGEVTIEGMQFNAKNITSLHGTGYKSPNVSADVTNLVDTIVTLEAMNFTDFHHRKRVSQVMRNSVEGSSFLMQLHKKFKEDSLAKNFSGFESGMQKGYVREVSDPNRSVVVADVRDEAEMNRKGFYRIPNDSTLASDMHDGRGKKMAIFVSETGGEASYLQGVLSTARLSSKGTSVLDGYYGRQKQELLAHLVKSKKVGVNSLFTDKPMKTKSGLAPIYNEAGRVVDYRYLMTDSAKDAYLQLDNRAEEVMASMYAGVGLKTNSVDVNSRLLNALKAQYEEDKAKGNLSRYVRVEANSRDKQLGETWNLLPEEARKEAIKLFGGEYIPVRNDLVNVAFGYRKWSIQELWNPESKYPLAVKEVINHMVSTTLGKKAVEWLPKIEQGVIGTVKDLKDIIVIKSIVVMIGNITSNMVQLPLLHGVSPIKAVKDTVSAFTLADEYSKDQKELYELQLRIDLNGGTKAQRERANELSQNMARNPVKPLIDAGMLQTIVEETEGEVDVFDKGLSAIVRNKLDPVVNQIPKGVRTTVATALLNQGTPIYDVLRHVTSLSDFSARFALFNHLTAEGMPEAEALETISDAFVNYDLPTSKPMQYLNDMGITWFFKYFIRMQKVIFGAIRSRPASILAASLGADMLGVDVTNPVESNVFNVNIFNKTGMLDGMSMAADAHIIAQMY